MYSPVACLIILVHKRRRSCILSRIVLVNWHNWATVALTTGVRPVIVRYYSTEREKWKMGLTWNLHILEEMRLHRVCFHGNHHRCINVYGNHCMLWWRTAHIRLTDLWWSEWWAEIQQLQCDLRMSHPAKWLWLVVLRGNNCSNVTERITFNYENVFILKWFSIWVFSSSFGNCMMSSCF